MPGEVKSPSVSSSAPGHSPLLTNSPSTRHQVHHFLQVPEALPLSRHRACRCPNLGIYGDLWKVSELLPSVLSLPWARDSSMSWAMRQIRRQHSATVLLMPQIFILDWPVHTWLLLPCKEAPPSHLLPFSLSCQLPSHAQSYPDVRPHLGSSWKPCHSCNVFLCPCVNINTLVTLKNMEIIWNVVSLASSQFNMIL